MVEGKDYRVAYYTLSDGSEPVRIWLGKLRDTVAKAQLFRRIGRLEGGQFGDCEPVGDGVHELRIDVGKGYRVYFGNAKNEMILLLVGGNKKTQAKDIKLAKAYWKEYKNRG